MKKVLFLIAVIVLVSLNSCTQNNEPKAKYVFLFIGDGMGVNQIYSAELFKASIQNKDIIEPLALSQLPIRSYVTTYSANRLITCSSAAGTALATGFKTNNGVVGKDTSLTINFETVAEKAKKSGYKVGVLSSVAIDHPTPASFYANQDKRSMYYEISMELAGSNFDYFGGGGFHYPKGKQGDKDDAIEYTISQGYNFVNTSDGFHSLKNGDEKVFAVNPQTYPQGEFYWDIDNKEGSISLADFTKKGIEVINNEKGFFMMVEGGKIDWACHGNDGATTIHETLAFDDAVIVALDFYNKYPEQTLIIVTADHETGGMATGNYTSGYWVKPELLQHQTISLQEFSRKISDLVASPEEESFDDVLNIIKSDFGLGNEEFGLALSEKELRQLKIAYLAAFKDKQVDNPDKDYLDSDNERTLPELTVHILNQKAGIGWSTYGHTGMPVPIQVIGSGQEYFTSTLDNTDIPRIIEKLMGM